ncbi:hypothetical protein [Parerythrobacter jejuensis]|uniref:Uncharacterized protein n=1 Tax=Parerythrobacter jejuensis TaxID=795812 RepID=A0A845ANK2_9SPHN|nr:hypothetical protein [Parerythrobacter jejuensis]MXP31039.1 hypothetical protein [Parerythrobacter jejuensis]MXP33799.1 hypothetical protein [Parerythrobacter jejuensis]
MSKTPAMRLFKADLYRNFAIGFVIGALVIGVQMSPEELSAIPQAMAATVR